MACLQTELERCLGKFAKSDAMKSATATLSQLIYEARHSLILKSYLKVLGVSGNEVVPEAVSLHIREQAGDCAVTLGRLTLVDEKSEFSCINLLDLGSIQANTQTVSEGLLLEVIPTLFESGGIESLMRQFIQESGIDIDTIKACALRFTDADHTSATSREIISTVTLCCLTLIINPRFAFQIDAVDNMDDLVRLPNSTFLFEIIKALLPAGLSKFIPLIKAVLPSLRLFSL